jgi:choline-sulfatase
MIDGVYLRAALGRGADRRPRAAALVEAYLNANWRETCMSRPNILILMVDQLNGTLFPDGPADWLHAPNLKRAGRTLGALRQRLHRLAALRAGAGLLHVGAAAVAHARLRQRRRVRERHPTFAHHLRRAGYHTCLSGKMHFVGPDQLHGFEERLTTDIYPADFGWTPDYRKPGERIDWWYHNLGSVTGAGVAEITNQLEYDDEVAITRAKLYDLARGHDARPWCLTVSFTHPARPLRRAPRFWDLYEDCAHLLPEVRTDPLRGAGPAQPAHLRRQRLAQLRDHRGPHRRARRAYFANISYLDDKIGEILKVLEARGRRRSSSSSRTTATCWASAGCGSR